MANLDIDIVNLTDGIDNIILENQQNINNPSKILVDIINTQKLKVEKANIWNNSIYKYVSTLESNNVGNVGEMLIQKICE